MPHPINESVEELQLEILPQPNDTTCGPTCLHAVYRYWGEHFDLDQVIRESGELAEGGTLASYLGTHALDHGYSATIYTYNVAVFDPTWFGSDGSAVADPVEKLLMQIKAKDSAKLQLACHAYIEFLRRGGIVKMEDLTRSLIRRYLSRSVPILTGLSSTFLYRSAREIGPDCRPDDIHGLPVGHFVVLCGYNKATKMVRVADPYLANPLAQRDHYYEIGVDRVVCAVLLGALTYDANFLIVRPGTAKGIERGDPDRRQ